MANEFIIKNGFHSKGNSEITGSLYVSQSEEIILETEDGASLELSDVVLISAPGIELNGDVIISGSLDATSSYAVSSSYALTSSQSISSSYAVSASYAENAGNVTTVSSSFSDELVFDTNKIMRYVGSSVSMSLNETGSILGNVILSEISASAIYHPPTNFKTLSGTFDDSSLNYIYYHYIGNSTVLLTISQEQ